MSQTVGVISVPEIKRHDIGGKDSFVVWASDGVWEFISSDHACKIINDNIKNLEAATEALNKEARKRWTDEEEVIDDITCEIFFFLSFFFLSFFSPTPSSQLIQFLIIFIVVIIRFSTE